MTIRLHSIVLCSLFLAAIIKDARSSFVVISRGASSHVHRATPQDEFVEYSVPRRNLVALMGILPSIEVPGGPVSAAPSLLGRLLEKDDEIYVVTPRDKAAKAIQQRETELLDPLLLSPEKYLLNMLPVNNPLFQEVESALDQVDKPDRQWNAITKVIETTIAILDKKRSQLEPVFNPEDNSMLQIRKGERGEILVEALRNSLVDLFNAAKSRNETLTLASLRTARLTLAEVGELLVSNFPYDIPSEGKYSFLPRLLGRARVTFLFRRGKNELLGNVTIVADGYTAPITAGNFVDLSARNFFTGLPVKFQKKRLGSGNEFEVASIPILGSFQQGFYDPLTGKLRLIPLEVIRVGKGSDMPFLSYSQGFASLTSDQATLQSPRFSRPLVSFTIPGLVGMNHPDKNENGASSECFALQSTSVLDKKEYLLDGEYAPFGVIVEGVDVFEKLRNNDIIDATFVDEWGQLNLCKLRSSSFSEVVKISEQVD